MKTSLSTFVSRLQIALVKKISRRAWRLAPEFALRGSAAVLALFALFGFNPQSLAATDTWTGATDTNWADSNWSGTNNPPLTGDSLIFGAADPSGATLTDNLMTESTYALNGITFASGAAAFTINAGTVSGNPSGFGLSQGALIINSSSVTQTINDNIQLLSTAADITTNSSGGNLILGGNISGAGELVTTAATTLGTLTITGSDTYTGNTQALGGTLNITGAFLGINGTPTGTIQIGDNGVSEGVAAMTITNSTIYAANLTEYGDSTCTLTLVTSAVNVTGNVTVNGNSSGGTGSLVLSSGTLSSATLGIGKDSKSFGATLQTAADTADGLQVNGGLLTLSGQLTEGQINSSANATVSNGVLTVNGALQIQSEAGGRFSLFSVTGSGTVNANGGLILGNFGNGANAEDCELLTLGGTINASSVAFDGNTNGGSGLGIEEWDDLGGTTYIGSGGITKGSGTFTAGSPIISVGAASGVSNSVVGASAPWSTTMGMTLTGTATFQTANSGGTAENITLNGVLGGSGQLNKTGAGTLTLGAANTYTGNTILSAGTVSLGITQGSTTGPLGGGSGSLPTGSLVFNGGTLQYTSLDTTDYSSKFSAASTAAASFDTNGQNITFGSVLTPTNTPGGLTLMDSAGTGSLTLNQPETFTAAATVNSGAKLILPSAVTSFASSAININGTLLDKVGSLTTNTLGGSGGTVTIGSGATLSMVDGTAGTLTLLGGLTVGGASAGNISLDIGATASDLLAIDGAISYGAGGGTINLSTFSGGSAPAYGTPYTIVQDPTNGGLILGDFAFGTSSLVVNIDGTNYTPVLSVTNGGDDLVVTLQQAQVNFYWTGNASTSSWKNITNFATDQTGVTAQTGALGATSNVFLTANSASNFSTETVDGNTTINSLSFTGAGTSAASGVTLNSGTATAPLTINGASAFSDAVGNAYSNVGLVVQPGAGPEIINTNINLGGSQTWQINNSSSNPVTMNGIIGGGFALTVTSTTATGELILTASNTYSGGTIVSGGTLKSGTNNALNPAGGLTVSSGTFDLSGFNQTASSLSDGGGSTGTITASTGSSILTVNNTTTGSYSGAITSGITLNLNGTGTETLSGSNSYTGMTNITNAETLVAANNYALGSPATGGLSMSPGSGTATVDFTSSNPTIGSLAGSGPGTNKIILGNSINSTPTTLTVGGAGATTVYSGSISDANTGAGAIGNLTLTGGSLTLNGSDSFTGTTVLTGGTLVLGNTYALGGSTLNYSGQGGTLSFGTLTAATFGALTGSQNIALTNTGSAGVALTVGGNGATESYSGVLSGAGSLTIANGSYTLSAPETYTGATTVNGGTLTMASTSGIGSSGTTSGAFTEVGGTVNINGAGVYVASITNDTGAVINVTAGTLSATGALAISSNNGAATDSLLAITGGTVTVGSVSMGRDASSDTGTAPTAASTTDGIYVNGGALNVTTTLSVGSGGSDTSTNQMRMDTGSVTVGGVTDITNNAGSRWSVLDINGGTFTDQDISGVGVLIGGDVANGSLDAELLLRDTGVLNTPAITLGNSSQTGGIDEFQAFGGTANIGSGGIVAGGATGTTLTINIGSSANATAPTIEASASWSSSLPMTLVNSSGSVAPTFQTSAGHNITLSGLLSGAGGLTAAGTGVLTVSGNDTYAGVTAVNGGTLVVSGSIGGSSATVTNVGSDLEVDNVINPAVSVTSSGELSGTGTLNGGATITGGTLAPGLSLANSTSAVGALTSGANVTLGSSSTFSIRIGLANGSSTDVDSLNVPTGTFSLTDSTTTLQLNTGVAESGAAVDTIYTIVNGGASATGVSGDWFANAPGQGDQFTTATGYQFDVFYAVAAGSTVTAGSDINVELIAVPEPGTWASLLGGIGMLVAWQRSRRRRS